MKIRYSLSYNWRGIFRQPWNLDHVTTLSWEYQFFSVAHDGSTFLDSWIVFSYPDTVSIHVGFYFPVPLDTSCFLSMFHRPSHACKGLVIFTLLNTLLCCSATSKLTMCFSVDDPCSWFQSFMEYVLMKTFSCVTKIHLSVKLDIFNTSLIPSDLSFYFWRNFPQYILE